MAKGEIRSRIKARLKEFLNPEVKPVLDQQIQQRVAEVLSLSNGAAALFHPMGTEPSLMPLAQSKKRRWAFPKLSDDGIEFYSFKQEPRWQTSRHGFMEPDLSACQQEPIENIEVVCVPGLAFDRDGTRLGRGGGHYDRALENFKGTKVGVAYSAQISNEPLPKESFDVAMNYVVTENFLLKVKG